MYHQQHNNHFHFHFHPIHFPSSIKNFHSPQDPQKMLRSALDRVAAMIHDYKYFDMRRETHIRLLTLLPGMPHDSLRTTLASVDMEDKQSSSFPVFECLSYAWGNINNRANMYVDGKLVSVTRNLADALLHLRHYEIPRVLWVDAICINQGNMAERSLQVGLMSQIYSRAQRVLVWLGPESSHSSLAMKAISQLSDAVDLDLETQTFMPLMDSARDWVKPYTQLPLSDEEINALCDLFRRPWFRRLWVWCVHVFHRPDCLYISDLHL